MNRKLMFWRAWAIAATILLLWMTWVSVRIIDRQTRALAEQYPILKSLQNVDVTR